MIKIGRETEGIQLESSGWQRCDGFGDQAGAGVVLRATLSVARADRDGPQSAQQKMAASV